MQVLEVFECIVVSTREIQMRSAIPYRRIAATVSGHKWEDMVKEKPNSVKNY